MNDRISMMIDRELGEEKADQLDRTDAYIINPYFEHEMLTPMQAIDCINHLSGALLADGCIRSQKERGVDISQTKGCGVRDFSQVGGNMLELFQKRAARDAE